MSYGEDINMSSHDLAPSRPTFELVLDEILNATDITDSPASSTNTFTALCGLLDAAAGAPIDEEEPKPSLASPPPPPPPGALPPPPPPFFPPRAVEMQ